MFASYKSQSTGNQGKPMTLLHFTHHIGGLRTLAEGQAVRRPQLATRCERGGLTPRQRPRPRRELRGPLSRAPGPGLSRPCPPARTCPEQAFSLADCEPWGPQGPEVGPETCLAHSWHPSRFQKGAAWRDDKGTKLQPGPQEPVCLGPPVLGHSSQGRC